MKLVSTLIAIRLDEDNFGKWASTGPYGPSSGIFFDRELGCQGGPPGSPDDDLDRYIEISEPRIRPVQPR